MNNTDEPELSGLMGYNPVWFWIMIFIALSIILITIYFILQVKAARKETRTPIPMFTTGYPEEIDKVFLRVSSQQMSLAEGCERVSLVIRDFLASRTGLPATSMTLTELKQNGAPEKVVQSVEYAYPIIFKNQEVTDYNEFVAFMNTSRAILDGWWG